MVPAGRVSAAVTAKKGVNKDEMSKAVECFLKSICFCSPSLSLKQSNKINNATVDEF